MKHTTQTTKTDSQIMADIHKEIFAPEPAPVSNEGEGFTPGEWMAKTNNGKDYLLVETNDKDCKTICKCLAMPFEEISIEQAEVNARLIASAPTLYRENKELREALNNLHNAAMNVGVTEWWQKHSDTVAKAKELLNRINK
jgi:hypothetical protein